MIAVQSKIFDPGAELNLFMKGRTDKGAVVSFTGHVRGGGDVTALELEHYPGYTEAEIEKIEASALLKWPGIESRIIHRFGKLHPGEPIVFVAVCAAHRKDAFEAASFLMDYLKTGAPFWKKEIRAGQEVWIEPKATDYAARRGWD
ncbi:MAG: molybdenum cofactor biosynthesis protein MoaE [Hellea sp.]|nr:molybdenum cofactor biosynthesis protein MoaE [Hellea sp.]